MINKFATFTLLVISFLMVFVSCNKDDDDNNNPNDPNQAKITAVTKLPVNTTSYIEYVSSEEIQVDWGDGNKVTYPVANDWNSLAGKIKGNTIKIYSKTANGITSLDIFNNSLTSLDVRNALGLVGLFADTNELSSLDIKNNDNLKFLTVDKNKIKQQAMNTILNDLPTRTEADDAYIDVYYKVSTVEQNELPSESAINNANNKKWAVNLD